MNLITIIVEFLLRPLTRGSVIVWQQLRLMSLSRPVASIHCQAGPQLNKIEVYCGLRLVILNWSIIPQQQPPKLRCPGTHLLPVSFDDHKWGQEVAEEAEEDIDIEGRKNCWGMKKVISRARSDRHGSVNNYIS